MLAFYLEKVPVLYFIGVGIVFALTVMMRGAVRRKEKEKAERRKANPPTSLID